MAVGRGIPDTALDTGSSRKSKQTQMRPKRFPDTEILIHVDPEGQVDRETMLPSEITEQAS